MPLRPRCCRELLVLVCISIAPESDWRNTDVPDMYGGMEAAGPGH